MYHRRVPGADPTPEDGHGPVPVRRYGRRLVLLISSFLTSPVVRRVPTETRTGTSSSGRDVLPRLYGLRTLSFPDGVGRGVSTTRVGPGRTLGTLRFHRPSVCPRTPRFRERVVLGFGTSRTYSRGVFDDRVLRDGRPESEVDVLVGGG